MSAKFRKLDVPQHTARGQSSASPNARIIEKCQRCRLDRQKCLPEDIERANPKCARCQKYDYVCSASRSISEERSLGNTLAPSHGSHVQELHQIGALFLPEKNEVDGGEKRTHAQLSSPSNIPISIQRFLAESNGPYLPLCLNGNKSYGQDTTGASAYGSTNEKIPPSFLHLQEVQRGRQNGSSLLSVLGSHSNSLKDKDYSQGDPWDNQYHAAGAFPSIMNHDPLQLGNQDHVVDASPCIISQNPLHTDNETIAGSTINFLDDDLTKGKLPHDRFLASTDPPSDSFYPVDDAHTRAPREMVAPTATAKTRGVRRGKLNLETAEHAAQVRKIGACRLCREKKIKCQHAIPSRWTAMAKTTPTSDNGPDSPSIHQMVKGDSKSTAMDAEFETPAARQAPVLTARRDQNRHTHLPGDCLGSPGPHDPETQSGNSDGNRSQSPVSGLDILMIQAKHELLVSLMKIVYGMFDQPWTAGVQTQATTESSRSDSQSRGRDLKAAQVTAGRKGKRRMQDRDSPPPDDGSGKRKKDDEAGSGAHQHDHLFACPFHKYDPRKYCSNSTSGATYRSCAGPGFMSISRLKQHLRRVHDAPIQCQRCWRVMSNMQEMSDHANEEIRCERREPQPEGISQLKAKLISSNRGASWENIYVILFPGAPIPSPYFETSVSNVEGMEHALPDTFEGQFEAYNRVMLPRLVEANLQVILDSEMRPIEENMRTLLMDIIRRCQMTVSENFRVTRSSGTNSMQPSSAPVIRGMAPTDSRLLGTRTSSSPTAAPPAAPDFPQQHVNLDNPTHPMVPTSLLKHNAEERAQTEANDSGYGTSQASCGCECHLDFDFGFSSSGSTNCDNCVLQHFDWSNDLQDLFNFPGR